MTNKVTEIEPRWLGLVRKSVEGLGYGVVQITVHAAQVVQIERTEKFRLEAAQAGGTRRTDSAAS